MQTLRFSHKAKSWRGEDNLINDILLREKLSRICERAVKRDEYKKLKKKHCIEVKEKHKALSERSIYSYAIGAQPEKENLTDWNFSGRYNFE